MNKFPHFYQIDNVSCGPTCLKIIASYYGMDYSIKDLIKLSGTSKQGNSLLELSEAAEHIGFRTMGVSITSAQLTKEIPVPCIAHWNREHFVVVSKITKTCVFVSDPGNGKRKYLKREFLEYWMKNGSDEGVLLLLSPRSDFAINSRRNVHRSRKMTFYAALDYLKRHRSELLSLVVGLISGSIFQLVFPLLTQSIVDIGIANKDYNFIYLILFFQLILFFSKSTIDIIRSYILMHISSRINMSLISDFFFKLTSLSIKFYDSKMTGDLMQRISDNRRIESFITGSSLSIIFSLFNLLVFSCVLIFYSAQVFFVFAIGSILYFSWILLFLKRRASLDTIRFKQGSQNQSKIIEIINGMQEIKLHNAERKKRWQLESMQIKTFKISLKSLKLSTIQNSGSVFINEIKTIIITFLSAKLVIDGELSLGMMLSISYIVGQLNAPVVDMVRFIQNLQDAKLSLDRLEEIHSQPNEENPNIERINRIPQNISLIVKNLSFKYSLDGVNVLKDISFELSSKKITAIVGSSGSGKTTLLKLLLKFYVPTEGFIQLGNYNLNSINIKAWRERCGVVMQEGFIFNDSIANNIAVNVDSVDEERLLQALRIANINGFVENLPLGIYTKLGKEGIGISTGQKQRILIARAIYKNPEYLFFDEATSALDSENERVIVHNLSQFYKGRTVIIIAHRLSTVKNADQILVLENGRLVEVGNHDSLVSKQGSYFGLVKNQLEFAN